MANFASPEFFPETLHSLGIDMLLVDKVEIVSRYGRRLRVYLLDGTVIRCYNSDRTES